LPFTTSSQETEKVYSYNPGARTGSYLFKITQTEMSTSTSEWETVTGSVY